MSLAGAAGNVASHHHTRPAFSGPGGSRPRVRFPQRQDEFWGAPGGRWRPQNSSNRRSSSSSSRCAAVKQGADTAGAPSTALQAGLLVVHKKDDKQVLALVEGRDGKTKFFVVDERGRRASVSAKGVTLVLPGSSYRQEDLARLADAAAGADASLLELLWSVAAEEVPARGWGLAELAALLFDDASAVSMYTTFVMLLADSVYFKQSFKAGAWMFEPRDAEAVAAAAAAAAQAAAAAAEAAAFTAAFNAARADAGRSRPASVQAQRQAWLEGPHGSRVAALRAFALRPAAQLDEPAAQLARDTLALLKRRPEPDVAAGLLAEAGLLRLHEPLAVWRAGRDSDREFEPSLEAAAQALLAAPPPDPDASTRRDLTHLTVFTIDDAGTTEIDDGLSVEADGDGGQVLWVHVADPTRWIQPGDALDLEARSRTRSLYFPFGAVPMFPRCLAEGPFSLASNTSSSGGSSSGSSSASSSSNGGSDCGTQQQSAGACCALSVCVALAEDGSLRRLVALTPSSIRVSHRLTYDEVDADLGLGPGLCAYEQLQALYAAARARRAWRMASGSIDIDMPEAKLEVLPEQLDVPVPAITCTKLSQWESAARMLVAEMMILAGEAVAAYGASAGLPLPFRTQEPPALPPEETLELLPEGSVRGYALRRCMTRSGTGAAPGRHAGLGLDAYVQVTSPIRRYSDMIAHYNLKAHLRGAPLPFPASSVAGMCVAAGEAGRELGRAEQEASRYWAAEYMRQHRGESWTALVLGPAGRGGDSTGGSAGGGGLVVVSLEELGLEHVVRVDFPVQPGDRLLLRLSDVDVKGGFFRLYVADRVSSSGDGEGLLTEEQLDEALMRDLAAAAGGSSSSSSSSNGGGGNGSIDGEGVLVGAG